MAYLVDVPVEGGGRLLVETGDEELPGDLELAAIRPGEVVARAKVTLEHALDELKPAITAVAERLKEMGPDQVAVEFGLKLGAQTGVVVAKGTSEVHFKVTATWGYAGHG